MARVDLYFGVPPGIDGKRAWTRFLADVVTPRFPDGLTSLDAEGQWRGPHGPAGQRTRIMIIFYRRDPTSDARIEAVRALYKRRFRQLSVLRADSSACIAF